MPSLQSLTRNIFNFAQLQFPLLSSPPSTVSHQKSFSPQFNAYTSSFEHTCPIDSPTSCHNSTSYPDSCCFIYPGGQLLQTQFWDTSPSIGPDDSWTLHGLWPDLCDGSYPTYCHSAPIYHNISAILSSHNASLPPSTSELTSLTTSKSEPLSTTEGSLLAYMHKYWLPNRGSPDSFWEHEWNKHGTCINTLAPSCYNSESETNSNSGVAIKEYSTGDEVVDFFTRAVSLFRELDTYAALAKAGILPSYTRTYRREELSEALKEVTGYDVLVRCRGNRLNEVWYSFNVKGSLQEGIFVPTEPVGKMGRSGCPEGGVRYLPK